MFNGTQATTLFSIHSHAKKKNHISPFLLVIIYLTSADRFSWVLSYDLWSYDRPGVLSGNRYLRFQSQTMRE